MKKIEIFAECLKSTMDKMIRFKFASLLVFLLTTPLLLLSQNKEEQKSFFTLGETAYSLSEFNYYFLKNSEVPSADSAKQKVKEYLDLYVKFRLKVQEALALGEDKKPDFIKEFAGYSKQLAEPYLMQTQVKGEMVQQAYERLQQEVSAAHILIKIDMSTSPEDTLNAYNETLSIKKRIENGDDFGKVAFEVSQDPSAKQNNGDLGYFSALQMVYPFENAVYDNEIGDVVGPVKTQFGYHILQVKDKRPARGKILTAHIMIQAKQDSVSIETARLKAQSVYENLVNGQSWEEQCELYSDDRRTKSSGGKLQWFGTGNLVPSYEDAAFELKKFGDYTEPIQTQFGWHIIKLLNRRELDSFDDMKVELEKKVSRDARAKSKKSTTLKNLKVSQSFSQDNEVKKRAVGALDSTLLLAKWATPSESAALNQSSLFTTNGQSYKVSGFWEFVVSKQKMRKQTSLKTYVYQLYNQYVEKCIFDEELKNIEQTNFDYQMVLDEYKSGILLFNLMEQTVWNKAMEDTLGLQTYYEAHLKDYKMDEHAIVRRFVSADSLVLQSVVDQLDKTNYELDSIFNAKEPLTLQTFDQKIEKKKNAFLSEHWEVGSFIEKGENYYTLWYLVELKPNGYKELKSIRGLVISDYQNELENEWIKGLEKKYPLKVNKAVLKEFITSFE